MEYRIEHYIPERLLIITVKGDVEISDLDQLNQEIFVHVQKMTQPIHNIFDISEVTKIPTNIREVARVLKWDWQGTSGWIIMVGGKRLALLGMVITTVSKIINLHVLAKHTVAEALTFLLHIDPTLKLLIPPKAQPTEQSL